MYNEFSEREQKLAQKKKQQKKLALIVLLLIGGLAYLFLVYLPTEKQKRQLEAQIKADLDKLQNIQPDDYNASLATLQNYLLLANGTEWQQEVLEDKREELQKAIEWLKVEQIRHLQEETDKAQRDAEKIKRKNEELARNKKLHWQREVYNWADELVHVHKNIFDSGWNTIVSKCSNPKDPPPCDFSAHYNIHFPPYCWSKLTNEQKYLPNGKSKPGIALLDKSEELTFTNKKILEWEQKILINPTRGGVEPQSGKDNNALFYGAPGTGKTSITKRLCLQINQYPMIELKGSSLTITTSEHDAKIQNIQKFIYTISDITWNLVDNFGFERAEDGEVRYILFVDEANQIEKNTFSKSPTYLVFLKECMEGVDKSKQSQNLWIFATNYLNEVDKAVYRPGRLSNPLDFSWTLGDFYEHARKANIYNQFPRHWTETAVLKSEDNEFVNKFSIKSFNELFLPFWRKFINHEDTKKDLPEIKERNSEGKEIIKQQGIQLGEFFEFFWNLKESGQLHHFNGKWESPRDDKLEDIVAVVRDTIDMRIDETNDLLQQIGTSINNLSSGLQQATSSTLEMEVRDLQRRVAELQNRVN